MASGSISKPVVDITDLGNSISANTDLNNVTMTGRYFCDSSNVGTISNLPVSCTSFDLLVMPRASSIRSWQILFAYATTTGIYYRAMTSANTWGDWKKLTDTTA